MKKEILRLVKNETISSIFDSLSDSFYILDRQGNYFLANKELVKRLKKKLKKEVVGKNIKDFHSKNELQEFKEILERAEKGPIYHQHLGKKGEWFMRTISTLKDKNGEIVGFVIVSKDVSNLREQTIRDPLTKLYNRKFLQEFLIQEVKRSKRYSYPISFLMVDINHFKAINDLFGHPVGDRVLKKVSELLRNCVRKEVDKIIRYGGDEFLIVCPETKEVKKLKERIITKLDSNNKKFLKFSLSLSIGISSWDSHRKETIWAVITKADRNMYREKKEKKKR